jgi:outer membrane protein assembly factor BamA
MRFGYEEPWLMGWPLNLGGRFKQEIRDTTYIEREWRFFVHYTPWSSFSVGVEGGRKDVLPDSLGSLVLDLARTKSWFVTGRIDYNTLDNPLNPQRGVRYHTALTLGKKFNMGPDFLIQDKDLKPSVHTRIIQIDAEAVLPLFSAQACYWGLHGTEVKSGEEVDPLSEQVRFGGATTLRGYPEDAFRGSVVAWTNLEYRYLFGRLSRVFVFLDVGIYQRKEASLDFVKGTKVGYGFGIRLKTQLGLMGIDYGLGEGDSITRGKVHIGLVNQF